MNEQKDQQHKQPAGPGRQNAEAGSPAWMDEPDIGSGEKTPGERETEAIVRSVPPTGPGSSGETGANGGQQQGGKK